MAYTYKEKGRTPSADNPNTLDVSIEFTSATDSFEKTVRFLSVKEIDTDFDKRMAKLIANREAMLAREIEDRIPVIKENAIEAILIEKGYLAAGEKLADLKTAADLIADKVG